MQKSKKTVVIGFVGSTLDQGKKEERWQRWRPTMSLLMHEDLLIDELVLLHDRRSLSLIEHLQQDAQQISPNTHISGHQVNIRDPWDFSDMYGALYDFVKSYPFDTENYQYLLHITTGTHVAQICWYLLVDAHYLPAKLIQSSPTGKQQPEGEYRIIDLDLSRYAALNQRFENEKTANWQQLKANIATKNKDFNQLIQEVELVATRSIAPILIMGATGVGKSHLAKQIYQLKKEKFHLEGRLVDVNCATLCGDGAMSALFGHIKGAFTGAANARTGYLKSADGGILFLDEIGELGLDEQAMLLKALEDKSFFPVGSDKEVQADFQLIAGTNKDLREEVQAGRFREDLWARLNTWTFFLPDLKHRREDIAPNIEFELQRFAMQQQRQLRFHSDALEKYLKFAQSSEATWQGNFRDLTASVTRMATLANGERIGLFEVEAEIQRLQRLWHLQSEPEKVSNLIGLLSTQQLAEIDEFDRIQLEGVIAVCQQSKSMADAGRRLFAISREQRQSTNDSDRVKKYLAKFGLTWADIG
ncbi:MULTISPECIES: RNA repair transcriptional activator RtcR [Acinetobacter]|uniref:RNA repair transcriptional activator RtcR n=1 Tax=Acinetobacter TaxID=469 RepID=UPI0010207BE8|nr:MULTISPECIES: RNA repair transcriptional activator RtcR [Acinetobacter]MDM1756483.1 sigma 54-interacting transcriptional regulator [Acinetobacter sp. 256-1]MDM1761564.1 sigma 54-interacting transcriptional regulator [Acinetobacter sp. 251-1]RYL26713.1 AAA family ATPase [Acinetobacter piscicola]